jgi:hypothetical protein
MLADILSVIQASGAQSVIPIAQTHGGWWPSSCVGGWISVREKMVFTSWNPIFTSRNPLAQPFLRARRAVRLPLWIGIFEMTMKSHGFERIGSGTRDFRYVCTRRLSAAGAKPIESAGRVLHVYIEPCT